METLFNFLNLQLQISLYIGNTYLYNKIFKVSSSPDSPSSYFDNKKCSRLTLLQY